MPPLQPLHTHTLFASHSPSPNVPGDIRVRRPESMIPPDTLSLVVSPPPNPDVPIEIEKQRLAIAEGDRIREVRMRELTEDRERKVRLEHVHDDEVRQLISDLQKKLDAERPSPPRAASVGPQWEESQRQWNYDRSVSPLPRRREQSTQPTTKLFEYVTGSNGESIEDICHRFRTDEERVRALNPHLATIESRRPLGPRAIVFVPVEEL